MFDRFDKDQYQLLLRQLDGLKQTGSVVEYQTAFEQLAHGILLYNPAFDDIYFVTRFIGGLKEEIRSAILLHRPKDVDTASALALLQEAELSSGAQRFQPRAEATNYGKSQFKNATEKKMDSKKSDPSPTVKSPSDDKFQALRTFRRNNGLCFKCGEKWGHNHKCPKQIPLHVVEELLEVFDTETEEDEPEDTSPTESIVLALAEASPVSSRRKTLKLLAHIGNHQVLILVDSGSVGTFVSKQLASTLQLPVQPCPETMYKAADGGLMQCDMTVPSLKWFIQGHTFSSEAKVLPLRCFDMILGEDWLEDVSLGYIVSLYYRSRF